MSGIIIVHQSVMSDKLRHFLFINNLTYHWTDVDTKKSELYVPGNYFVRYARFSPFKSEISILYIVSLIGPEKICIYDVAYSYEDYMCCLTNKEMVERFPKFTYKPRALSPPVPEVMTREPIVVPEPILVAEEYTETDSLKITQ